MSDIRRSVDFDAPIERVWAFLTEPEKIAQWLMPNTFSAVAGHAFTMDCPPGIGSGAPIECEVLRIEPPHGGRAHLTYTWAIDAPALKTVLTLDLNQEGGTTRLELVHSGWEPLAPSDMHVRDRHEQGWDALLEMRLRPLLEGGTG